MNTSVMFSSKSDEWETPIDVFNRLNEEFDFDLDPCADENNHKCDRYFTKKQNGLIQNWGAVKCFVIRHMEKKFLHGFENAVMKAKKKTQWLLC